MAVTAHIYPKTLVGMAGATAVNLTTDTFTAALMTGDASAWTTGTIWGYTFASTIAAAYTEISTVGTYTAGYAGRVALSTLTFTQRAATNDNIVVWTCSSPSPIAFGGGAATISARSMFINDKTAKSSAADTSSVVITIIDFGATVSSTAGAYTYTVDATNGLAYFTMS